MSFHCNRGHLRVGLDDRSLAANGYNLTHTFPPIVAKAYRVLEPEGIFFTTFADLVHNYRFQCAS